MQCSRSSVFPLLQEFDEQTSPTLLEITGMKVELAKLYTTIQTLIHSEQGQDLIEYALVVALIAFAATAGMTTVATNINTTFSNIGTALTAATA